MMRIIHMSKLMTNLGYVGAAKVFVEVPVKHFRNKVYVSKRFLSSKNDKGDCADKKNADKKVEKEKVCIESHPMQPPSKDSATVPPDVKLRECKPVDINPCQMQSSLRIPSIQDCKVPNEMNRIPQPECPWDEAEKKNTYGRTLLLGALFTFATLGALYYLVFMEREDEKPKAVIVKKKKKTKKEVIKNPARSSDIPNEVPYLLIGGGTASFSAFRAIKSSDPTAKVLVVTNESFYPYMRPPLSKEIWFNEDSDLVKKLIFKQWNGSERSLFYEPDDFYVGCKELMGSTNGGVAVARGWNVTHLDVVERIAYLEDGYSIKYNKCLIATGATPKLTNPFEVALATNSQAFERIKIFRNVYDFEDVYEAFEESKSIAIIGGGFLGSELACALARKDKKHSKHIYQMFREGGNMGKILPEYLSYWTTEKVKAEGVDVLVNVDVVGAMVDNDKGVTMTLNNGKTMTVDQVIVAVGVEPNTELAEKSDLEVDPELGGYLVNTELQARSDLYIAGDCACFYDPRLGRRRIEHHDHAVVSGRLAGENMAGGRQPYLHQSMFWSDLGPDVGYEAIGIVDSTLPTVGVFAKATAKDSPKAVVTATDEGIRSKTEEMPKECDKYLSDEQRKELEEKRKASSVPNKHEGEDFGKGVIFYLRDDIVVGVVLWNVFNRMSIARQVLKDQKKYDDLNEVAKLFNIHEE